MTAWRTWWVVVGIEQIAQVNRRDADHPLRKILRAAICQQSSQHTAVGGAVQGCILRVGQKIKTRHGIKQVTVGSDDTLFVTLHEEFTRSALMVQDAQLVRFYVGLTARQRAVLPLASEGLTNPQIGARLNIQPSVVAGHLTNIYAQLGSADELVPSGAPNRYVLVRLFAGFFGRHTELGTWNEPCEG